MGYNNDIVLKDAFHILSLSQKSSNELRRLLASKGHNERAVEKTIKRLKSLNYLDDFKYALDWGRRRIKKYPMGMRLMQSELEKKDIESDIINDVIRILYQEQDEKDMASNLLAQKLASNRKSHLVNRNWIIGLLHRRGFSPEIIQEIMEPMILGSPKNIGEQTKDED